MFTFIYIPYIRLEVCSIKVKIIFDNSNAQIDRDIYGEKGSGRHGLNIFPLIFFPHNIILC